MKRRLLCLFAAAALSAGGSVCSAQDFGWEITLANGERYTRVALDRVGNDTLYFLQNKNLADWVLVDSLSQLRRERRSAILPAALIGGVGGGALGIAFKPAARDQEQANIYSVAFGVVVGSVAGYVVGATLQPDEVFDLQPLNRGAKVELLKKIAQ